MSNTYDNTGYRGTQAFQRVLVDYLLQGGARISWTIARHFRDPDPDTWRYTLQVSEHRGLPSYDAQDSLRDDDWQDVGSTEVNVNQLLDSSPRAFGKTLLVSYRVRLETDLGLYYSPPAVALGKLNKQDWLRAREIIRKEQLLHRKGTSNEGYLLRRKRTGTPCTKCLDPATGDVTLSRCDLCQGTRYLGGYFAPVSATFCRIEPNSTREHRKPDSTGTEKQDVTQGRIVAVPGLESMDVWVDGDTDLRYHVHVVGIVAQIRSVPLVLNVELRQAPFDDPVYRITLPTLNTPGLRFNRTDSSQYLPLGGI